MMMLCSKQTHLIVLSALLTLVYTALFNNGHFAIRIPKTHSTHLLACDSLQLKTRSSHDISFLAKGFIKDVFRGRALSPRMTKGTSFPLPPKLAGFLKVDSDSSKKWYKAEPKNVPPPLCLPLAPMSIKTNLLLESATTCNTIKKIVCNCKTVIQLL